MDIITDVFKNGGCFSSAAANYIQVKFKNNNELNNYTMAVFDDLKQDKSVEYIIDAETGEVLFYN